jgi:Holliday junction resolvasome RuvABC endonuclease subunit
MKTLKPYKLGIDPGFRLSGLVLCKGFSDPEVWALHKMEPGIIENQNLRAQSLATGMIDSVLRWVERFDIQCLEIAIELPVWRHNAQTLILQTRLLQELETGLTMLLPSMVKDVWITEVNPTTSKRVLTGDSRATKEMMVSHSPWAETWEEELDNFDQAHTLADAFAHAQSAHNRQYNLAEGNLYANTLVMELE